MLSQNVNKINWTEVNYIFQSANDILHSWKPKLINIMFVHVNSVSTSQRGHFFCITKSISQCFYRNNQSVLWDTRMNGFSICKPSGIYISTAWLYTIRAQSKLKEKAFTNNISSEIRTWIDHEFIRVLSFERVGVNFVLKQ